MFLAMKADAISIPDALLVSLIGFTIVFAVLVVLMAVIKIITAAVSAMEKKPEPVAAVPQASIAPAAPLPDPNAGKIPAPGSLGECDLHAVDDKTAAMLMAIVADEMKAPLNELRFISIQEVQEEKRS